MRARTTRTVTAALAAAIAGPLLACSAGAPDPAAAFARASRAPPRAAPATGDERSAPAPAPSGPAPTAAAAPPAIGRRYAGGRPIAWWSERLARLRRDGPEDVYRLTVERARLNGLEVVEREGGEVAVALPGAGVVAEARP
jgi:hypothetical protein